MNASTTSVLYPGSFDPLHLGHVDVVEQGIELFGQVVVVVMHNPTKPSGVFTIDERMAMISASLADLHGVQRVLGDKTHAEEIDGLGDRSDAVAPHVLGGDDQRGPGSVGRDLVRYLDMMQPELVAANQDIWTYAEVGLQEHRSAARLVGLLT